MAAWYKKMAAARISIRDATGCRGEKRLSFVLCECDCLWIRLDVSVNSGVRFRFAALVESRR
jgi:hypothetical protein